MGVSGLRKDEPHGEEEGREGHEDEDSRQPHRVPQYDFQGVHTLAFEKERGRVGEDDGGAHQCRDDECKEEERNAPDGVERKPVQVHPLLGPIGERGEKPDVGGEPHGLHEPDALG